MAASLPDASGAPWRAAPDLDRMAALLRPLASPVRLRLLRLLVRPHYLEEVASALGLSRQAARKHLDKLVSIGVVERNPTSRPGPVSAYVINPRAVFLVYSEFEKLGDLQRAEPGEDLGQTLAVPGQPPAARRPAGPCMSIVRGFGVGTTMALAPEAGKTWLVGRDSRCEVVLAHDPYASNRQAEIAWVGGRFVLTDLRSTNGTEHNWCLLPRGGSVALQHGDLVGVGKTLLLFWDGPRNAEA